MFAKKVSNICRNINLKPFNSAVNLRSLSTKVDPLDETARSAFEKSCYLKIDWKINENSTVLDAINRMVANKIGALAVTNDQGNVIGVISERDYLCKIGFLGKTSKSTKVSEICTHGEANLVSVTLDNPIDACMAKMLNRNVRHLLIREKGSGNMVGMISVKDIVKCAIAKQDAVVDRLTEMVVMSEVMRKDV
jgi:signal-transduction protein with cAMP-binding, CBS, and nucleotidyltransferase domain